MPRVNNYGSAYHVRNKSYSERSNSLTGCARRGGFTGEFVHNRFSVEFDLNVLFGQTCPSERKIYYGRALSTSFWFNNANQFAINFLGIFTPASRMNSHTLRGVGLAKKNNILDFVHVVEGVLRFIDRGKTQVRTGRTARRLAVNSRYPSKIASTAAKASGRRTSAFTCM